LSAAGGSDDDEEGDAAEEAALQGGEGRFADEAAVAAELKEMDEIYEVLAKVRRGWVAGGAAAASVAATAAAAVMSRGSMRCWPR
jgi:hypothetical protein